MLANFVRSYKLGDRATYMNLGFIAKTYDIVGGTERNLFELTKRLARWGHKVHLYCLNVNLPPEPGVQIHRLRSFGLSRTAHLRSYGIRAPNVASQGQHDLTISFARSIDQDIIRNGGGTHPCFLARMAQVETTSKRIIRSLDPYHRTLLSIEKRQYTRPHYKKIIANSDVVKQEIMETYNVPEEDVQVIYNGVNTDLFNPQNAARYRASVRKHHQIPQDATTLLFVGNAFKRKGLLYLLQAMAQVKHTPLYGIVVGGDPALAQFKSKTKELGLGKRMVFTGVQAEPFRYYAAADFFVLPALHEPFGHATLEAMASGLPVIGATRTGASNLLKGELKSFLLDDVTDVRTLTNLIERMLKVDTRKRLAQEALETSQAYTLDANALAIQTLCEQVMEAKLRTQAA